MGPATPTIIELETKIRFDLESVIPDRKEAMLVRAVAIWQAAAFFENTYGLIFGSQIAALELLNSRTETTLQEAHSFFESEAKPKFDRENVTISFETWSDFLKVRQLAAIDDGKVAILERGKEFLTFLDTRSLTHNKFL